MNAFLDHVVTVRDVLYAGLALFVPACAFIGWLTWLTHPTTEERRRRKRGF